MFGKKHPVVAYEDQEEDIGVLKFDVSNDGRVLLDAEFFNLLMINIGFKNV